MPTLPDLFEDLGAHGEHAGADTVVARALAAAHSPLVPMPLIDSARPRRTRHWLPVLTAAAVTLALIAVPVALRSGGSPHPSRQPSGPPYASPASATAAQLARFHWSPIAAAPIQLVAQQLVAWAGDEVVVFGQDFTHDNPHGAGAAYSPTTDTWRTLPRAPLKGDWFFTISWTWTGRELIVFPDTIGGTEPQRGEAYSPKTDSWRVLAPAPFCTMAEPGVAWTGTRVVVTGGYDVAESQCSATRNPLGARVAEYDPATDRWTEGPRLRVRHGDRFLGTKLAWAGDHVVAVVASQRGVHQTGSTNSTVPGSTTTVGTAEPLTRSDPIVRSYSWIPGASTWQPLDNITTDMFGQTPNPRWSTYAAGSRVVYPPTPPFCGEGDLVPCSSLGSRAGVAYDVATGRQVKLLTPQYEQRHELDSTAFAGESLIATAQADTASGSGAQHAFAWDLTTGRLLELAPPPQRMFAAVWTGHEMIAIGLATDSGPLTGLRLGP